MRSNDSSEAKCHMTTLRLFGISMLLLLGACAARRSDANQLALKDGGALERGLDTALDDLIAMSRIGAVDSVTVLLSQFKWYSGDSATLQDREWIMHARRRLPMIDGVCDPREPILCPDYRIAVFLFVKPDSLDNAGRMHVRIGRYVDLSRVSTTWPMSWQERPIVLERSGDCWTVVERGEPLTDN